jgi:zinc/manganese transport system permease protein
LIGNILFVSWPQVQETALVYAAVGLIHWIFRRQFWAASRKSALSFGWDFLFYILFGIVISFSTPSRGRASGVCDSCRARRAGGTVFSDGFAPARGGMDSGGDRGYLAFALSYRFDLPAGAGIVTLLTALFFLVLTVVLIFEAISRRDDAVQP